MVGFPSNTVGVLLFHRIQIECVVSFRLNCVWVIWAFVLATSLSFGTTALQSINLILSQGIRRMETKIAVLFAI